jgi:drug/metabolite transporter (DMT)-like permease
VIYLGELAALGTAVCWTFTSLAFEAAGRRVGSLAVNLIRLVLALGLLTAYSALVRGQALPTDATAHAWIWLSISGLVGFTIGDLCLFRAFVVIGARLSMLMMALVPLIAALTGWLLLNERLTPLDGVGMALTVSGVAWVVLERERSGDGGARRASSGPSLAGVLLGLGGAAGQAVGLVLSKLGMGSYDAFAATQIRALAGVAGFILLFSVIGWWPRVRAALSDGRAMGGTAVGALFGPFLGVSLSLVAIKHTHTGVAATLMALVPVLIIPASVWIKGERITRRSVGGAAVAVAGSALLFLPW